ncbi:MAG: ABC transporter permease [Bacteroidales bacterium]
MNRNRILKKLYQQKYLFLLIIPGLVGFFIFNYIPMGGIVIAFKDYDLVQGIWKSPWVGIKYFEQFITGYHFKTIMRNTIGISLMKLFLGFPVPIIFALLLNEIKNYYFKRTIQTISYLPHFLSWVVALGIIGKILSVDGGIVNELLIMIGKEPVNFFSNKKAMWPLIYLSEIWKETGWNSIIYLAALATIDVQLYEAAYVDGANRFKRMWHISLPGIKGTIAILFILAAGNILHTNFDQLYLLATPPVIDVTEVIDTYIYRRTLQNMQYSLGAAAGLFKAILNVCIVFMVNGITKKLTGEGIW